MTEDLTRLKNRLRTIIRKDIDTEHGMWFTDTATLPPVTVMVPSLKFRAIPDVSGQYEIQINIPMINEAIANALLERRLNDQWEEWITSIVAELERSLKEEEASSEDKRVK